MPHVRHHNNTSACAGELAMEGEERAGPLPCMPTHSSASFPGSATLWTLNALIVGTENWENTTIAFDLLQYRAGLNLTALVGWGG